MRVSYWVKRPRALFARMRYWLWEKQNPDKPWLTPGAVSFLDAHLARTMTGLEFGSGRSTAWYAKKIALLTSIEHHAGWYEAVHAQLTQAGLVNVDYRLIPLDHPEAEPEHIEYHPTPNYVAVAATFPDDSLDFVVVDGHYRSHCIRAALAKIKPGGLLLVDDANLWPGNAPPVPGTWVEVSRTTNGLKFTAIWRKPA